MSVYIILAVLMLFFKAIERRDRGSSALGANQGTQDTDHSAISCDKRARRR
jgi:hypothetical protein